MESLSSSDDDEVQRITAPKVVLNSEDNDDSTPQPQNLPPVLRRARFRKASTSPAGSPKITSPEASPLNSPRTTPRGSPVNSPRGVRKLIKRGKVLLCTSFCVCTCMYVMCGFADCKHISEMTCFQIMLLGDSVKHACMGAWVCCVFVCTHPVVNG